MAHHIWISKDVSHVYSSDSAVHIIDQNEVAHTQANFNAVMTSYLLCVPKRV